MKKVRNKSEAIRDYARKNPTHKPAMIAEMVSKQLGEKINPMYVSQILYKAVQPAPLDNMLAATHLKRSFGGWKGAIEFLQGLRKLDR